MFAFYAKFGPTKGSNRRFSALILKNNSRTSLILKLKFPPLSNNSFENALNVVKLTEIIESHARN